MRCGPVCAPGDPSALAKGVLVALGEAHASGSEGSERPLCESTNAPAPTTPPNDAASGRCINGDEDD